MLSLKSMFYGGVSFRGNERQYVERSFFRKVRARIKLRLASQAFILIFFPDILDPSPRHPSSHRGSLHVHLRREVPGPPHPPDPLLAAQDQESHQERPGQVRVPGKIFTVIERGRKTITFPIRVHRSQRRRRRDTKSR